MVNFRDAAKKEKMTWRPVGKKVCGRCGLEYQNDNWQWCLECRKIISEKLLSSTGESSPKVAMIKSSSWISRLIRRFESWKSRKKELKEIEECVKKAGSLE